MVHNLALEKNLKVCGHCGHHFAMGQRRLASDVQLPDRDAAVLREMSCVAARTASEVIGVRGGGLAHRQVGPTSGTRTCQEPLGTSRNHSPATRLQCPLVLRPGIAPTLGVRCRCCAVACSYCCSPWASVSERRLRAG